MMCFDFLLLMFCFYYACTVFQYARHRKDSRECLLMYYDVYHVRVAIGKVKVVNQYYYFIENVFENFRFKIEIYSKK